MCGTGRLTAQSLGFDDGVFFQPLNAIQRFVHTELGHIRARRKRRPRARIVEIKLRLRAVVLALYAIPAKGPPTSPLSRDVGDFGPDDAVPHGVQVGYVDDDGAVLERVVTEDGSERAFLDVVESSSGPVVGSSFVVIIVVIVVIIIVVIVVIIIVVVVVVSQTVQGDAQA
jgi:hypothetical protein